MRADRSIYNLPVAIALFFVLAGCQSLRTSPAGQSRVTLPDAFPGHRDQIQGERRDQDATHIADMSWRHLLGSPKLVALIDSALAHNFDVRAAWQRVAMARAGVLATKGDLKPVAEMDVLVSQRRFGRYTMDGAGNISTDMEPGRVVPTHLRDYSPAVQASWEVDVWGKLRNRKRAAMHRLLASEEGRHAVVTDLVAEVASCYYELMGLDSELAALDETLALQERAYRIIQLQKEAAAANELAVKQFEAQLLSTRGIRAEVRQQVVEMENRINFLLGRFPQPVPRDSLVHASLSETVGVGIPAAMLRNRPDIRRAERELLATQADTRAARAAFYPALNLSGNIGLEAYRASLLFVAPESVGYGIFANLTAPLFNRSEIRAGLQLATARQREALVDYERALVNSYNEVVNHLSAKENLREVYLLKEQEVDAWSQSVETASELFRTGRATYLEVILTQQNALAAKRELIDVRERQLITTVNLYRALGGGWK